MMASITDRQRAYIDRLLEQLHLTEREAATRYPDILSPEATANGLGIPDLSRAGASMLIDRLRIERAHIIRTTPKRSTTIFARWMPE